MIFIAKWNVPKVIGLLSVFFCGLAGPLEAAGVDSVYARLSSGRISVEYQAPDSKIARQYLSLAAGFIPRPEWQRGIPLAGLEIIIAPTEAEFRRLSGGLLPEWGLACALPERDLVIVRSPRLLPVLQGDPEEILLHEISHVFLDQQLRPAEIPRWFQEGYALYCSRMWDTENFFEFSVAILLGKVRPLSALSASFPVSEAAAHLAYLESYTVVEYIFLRWEKEQLELLFKRWREQGDLDRGLRLSLGLTLAQFEVGWRQWAEVRYGWLKLATSVTLIWILAAGLFIAVYISRRVRFKKRLAEMRSREAIQYDWPLLEAALPPEEPAEDKPPENEEGRKSAEDQAK